MSQKKEIVYDDIEIGQELPPITYNLTENDVKRYLAAAEETNPIYLNESSARRAGLRDRVTPPMIACMYAAPPELIAGLGGVFPAHSIHSKGEYTFVQPVKPGDTITVMARVDDKYIKKGRKYVTLAITAVNQDNETVLINRHTSAWPK